MDLVLRNVRLADGEAVGIADIGITDGRITAVEPGVRADAEEMDLDGRFAVAGFVESHIHLDKACILDRCQADDGTLDEAIREVAKAKQAFTVEDIRQRAMRTLDKCILQGTTRMRTHLEVDPSIGVQGIEAVVPLVAEYRWAIDLQICVFPQEGLLNNPGTDELMVDALRRGATVVGGCPYTDSNPRGQIDRIFQLAQQFDVDIDFHLDFDTNPEGMTIEYVCEQTEKAGWSGRVVIGHVSKLSALDPARLKDVSRRLAGAGVGVTVLPSTDLFLMGADRDHDIVRGVAPVHRMIGDGVNCALSTNNVLNPFTPFGDCSLVRMANLYANIGQIGTRSGMRDCVDMVTTRPARLLRLPDYGIRVGNPADIVVLDCQSPEAMVQELAVPMFGFKNGRRTFTRLPPELHKP